MTTTTTHDDKREAAARLRLYLWFALDTDDVLPIAAPRDVVLRGGTRAEFALDALRAYKRVEREYAPAGQFQFYRRVKLREASKAVRAAGR